MGDREWQEYMRVSLAGSVKGEVLHLHGRAPYPRPWSRSKLN